MASTTYVVENSVHHNKGQVLALKKNVPTSIISKLYALEWLEKSLREASSKSVLLFAHYPLVTRRQCGITRFGLGEVERGECPYGLKYKKG